MIVRWLFVPPPRVEWICRAFANNSFLRRRKDAVVGSPETGVNSGCGKLKLRLEEEAMVALKTGTKNRAAGAGVGGKQTAVKQRLVGFT